MPTPLEMLPLAWREKLPLLLRRAPTPLNASSPLCAATCANCVLPRKDWRLMAVRERNMASSMPSPPPPSPPRAASRLAAASWSTSDST